MMPQTLSELKIALKKRRLLAISFLLLPLPLLIMMAVQGNNFASIAQSGDQLKVGFVLLGFALLISTIVVQVFYTAQILTEPLNQPPLGFFKTLLYYLPGNFIIL